MVQIKIKGLSNHYHVYAFFDDEVAFLHTLEERLQQCSHNGEHCFEAFFHLPNMSKTLLSEVFMICERTHTLMLGVNDLPEEKHLRIWEEDLYNGQHYTFDEPLLLLGNVAKQAFITSSYSLYVMGSVLGNIDLLHEDCRLSASKIDGAVRICDSTWQNVTSFSPVSVYYESRHLGIHTYKEERMWERQLQSRPVRAE